MQREYQIELSVHEINYLNDLTHKTAYNTTINKRCRILLAVNSFKNSHYSIENIADICGASLPTVRKIITLYQKGGLAKALETHINNEKAVQAVARITPYTENYISNLVKQTPPDGKRWTLSLLTKQAKHDGITISLKSIHRIIQKLGLTMLRHYNKR